MAEKKVAEKMALEKKPAENRLIRPQYRIHEENGAVVISVEMPGVEKNDIKMNIEKNELRIQGPRKDTTKSGRLLIRERRRGDFFQAFTLDVTVDQNRVDAAFEKGILSVTLHLKEEVKPKQISIRTS